MKKIFTLLTILAISVSSFADGPQTKLTINTASKNNVRVLVDGYTYNQAANTSDDIQVSNLTAGYHSIKVYELSPRNRNGASSNAMRLLYNGNVYVKNGYHTDVTINRFGKALVDERMLSAYEDDNAEINTGNDWSSSRHAMSPIAFSQFKQALAKTSFDGVRQNMAKQTLDAYYMSTDQVIDMLNTFGFESSKLDIAKYAYAKTLDKQNYFLVNSVFNFSSSQDALINYVRAQ